MFPFRLPSASFLPQLYCPDGAGFWSGHLPFACDLVVSLRPTIVVELGAYYGESYFTFCQAIAESGTECAAYAVDTWEGDRHTGRYSNAVFSRVESYNGEHYAGFSRLIRASFDAALPLFSDGSIDILHIDGLHTYDAVKNDFNEWLPKVRPGGIVLLHDIAIKNDDFGVWKFWDELVLEYKTFSFQHSSGLGVLLKPGPVPAEGIAAVLFGGDGVGSEVVQAYYGLCADRLLHRFGLRRPPMKAATGVRTRIFWRPADEPFSEPRSTQLYSTVLDRPETIVLDVPPQPDVITELRLDIADSRAQLELQSLRVLNSKGKELWIPDLAGIFQAMPYSGMRTVVKEKLVFLDISDGGSQMVLRTPKRLLRRLSEGLVVELRVRALSSDEIEQIQFSSGRDSGGDRSITTSESVVEKRLRELRNFEVHREITALREALRNAECIVATQAEELQKYDTALGDAQRFVAERSAELVSLSGACSKAEALAATQVQELRGRDEALAALQLLVTERDARISALNLAYEGADRVALDREKTLREALKDSEFAALEREKTLREAIVQELRGRDEALAASQLLVTERDARISALNLAYEGADRVALDREKIISEREAEIGADRRKIRQLQEERAGLSLRITEFENSRAIRLARLLGRGLRWR